MSYEHGLSDELIVIFEELIASDRTLIAPLSQDAIRAKYAILLVDAEAFKEAERHAQIVVENYALHSMILDFDVSLAIFRMNARTS